jgi:hypothetical protein
MLKTVAISSGGTNGTVTNIATGTGLTGGPITTTGTISLANTAVVAGSYGNASTVSQVTINAQGQVTNAVNVAIVVANSAVTGLGTMSTQNANAVAITGGSAENMQVGTVTPNTGKFTVLTVTTSSTLGNATATQLNNTPIGNNSPSTGAFTNLSSSNVTITGGTENNLTYTNVSILSGNVKANVTVTNATNATATYATSSLLLVPAGFIQISLANSTVVKIPYYAA